MEDSGSTMGRDFAVDSLQVQQRRFADSIADCGSRDAQADDGSQGFYWTAQDSGVS
jgi:hypothetical protein